MSLPNASIANLPVTRKTLDASIDKKPHTRAFGSHSRAYSLSLLAPVLGTRRRCESFKGHENKKPALERRRPGLETILLRRAWTATRIARLLLDAGVGRGDRLQRVGGDAGVKLGNLGRLGDEALVSLLGEFGLDLDGRFDAAGPEKLLEHGGAGGEGLLRIVGRLGGDILQAFRQGGRGGGERFQLVLGELLELVE
jgi:hypothetical protein